MEVQTFFLGARIRRVTPGVRNAEHAGAYSFYPLDGTFPFAFTMAFFILLRRDYEKVAEDFSLRFDLVDEDGRKAGEPWGALIAGRFSPGELFCPFDGRLGFRVARPGVYRLDIRADEQGLASLYSYTIEVTMPPGGQKA